MHQSLCNPPKSSLLSTIYCGFLRGTPPLTTKAIIKYLPPNPATSKGLMKHPRQGLCSMTPKLPCLMTPTSALNHSMSNLFPSANHDYNFNKDEDLSSTHTNLINDFDDHSIANIFCFGLFADKTTGVVYNDCTRDFPFMLLNGDVCFFVMYHYKTNAILAMYKELWIHHEQGLQTKT